jgi:hypothetical protein
VPFKGGGDGVEQWGAGPSASTWQEVVGGPGTAVGRRRSTGNGLRLAGAGERHALAQAGEEREADGWAQMAQCGAAASDLI